MCVKGRGDSNPRYRDGIPKFWPSELLPLGCLCPGGLAAFGGWADPLVARSAFMHGGELDCVPVGGRRRGRPREPVPRSLERQPGFEPGSSAWEAGALPHELLPLLVWLLITGWLTLWRRHSRVGHALLVHHPDVVLPAGPSVCAEFAAARIGVPCFTQQGRRLCGRAVNRWLLPRPPHRFVM